MKAGIKISKEEIASFCLRNKISKLSLFGSVLRADFHKASDVDVLVEFQPDARVGLITLAGMEIELGNILKRKVDMNTSKSISPYYRDTVLAEAEVLYEQT